MHSAARRISLPSGWGLLFGALVVAASACLSDEALRLDCESDENCAAGQRCVYGACIASDDAGQGDTDGALCGSGRTECEGSCVDVETDPLHCGTCERVCETDQANTEAVCMTRECAVTCEGGQAADYTGRHEWRCDQLDNDCDGSADEACCDTSDGATLFADRPNRVLGTLADDGGVLVRLFVESEGSAEFVADTIGADGAVAAGEPQAFDCPTESPSVDTVRFAGGGVPMFRCGGGAADTYVALTPGVVVMADDIGPGVLEPLAAVSDAGAWFAYRYEVREDVDAIEVQARDGSGDAASTGPIEPGGMIASLSITADDDRVYLFGISPFDLGIFGVAVDQAATVVAGPDPLANIDVDTDVLPPLTTAFTNDDGVWLAWSAPTTLQTTVFFERISMLDGALTASRSASFVLERPVARLVFVANNRQRPLVLVDDLGTIHIVDARSGEALAALSRTSMPNEIEVDQVVDAVMIDELLVIAGSDARGDTVYQPVALDGTLLCPEAQ